VTFARELRGNKHFNAHVVGGRAVERPVHLGLDRRWRGRRVCFQPLGCLYVELVVVSAVEGGAAYDLDPRRAVLDACVIWSRDGQTIPWRGYSVVACRVELLRRKGLLHQNGD